MSDEQEDSLFLGWTTCETLEIAKYLAKNSVQSCLAACVQISGPIESYYRWEGNVEVDQEYRILFKFHHSKLDALHEWIREKHPYENPQWYAVKADAVAPDYLKWAKDCM